MTKMPIMSCRRDAKRRLLFAVVLILVGLAGGRAGSSDTGGLNAMPLLNTQEFSIAVSDGMTIRQNPTTQLEIAYKQWPGNVFLLWFPEIVGQFWNQWTPEVAHQDFEVCGNDKIRWVFDKSPDVHIEAVLKAVGSTLDLEVRMTNRSGEEIRADAADKNGFLLCPQNCFHLSAAPDFACEDFTRVFVRADGKWRSLSSLSPSASVPVYYRSGFLEDKRSVSWSRYMASFAQEQRADHPLIVCVSKDRQRAVATASEDYECVFHNSGVKYLLCIHSQQTPVPKLAAGATAVFRQRIFFVEGGLRAAVSAYEASVQH